MLRLILEMLDNLPDALSTWDANGNLVFANRTMNAYFGRNCPQTIQGIRKMLNISEEKFNACIEKIRQKLSVQMALNTFIEDRQAILELRMNPIKNDWDEFIGYSVLIRNITEEMKLLTRQGTVNRQELIERFSEKIIHKIANRLQDIIADVGFIKEICKQRNNTEYNSKLDDIEKEIVNIASLLKSLQSLTLKPVEEIRNVDIVKIVRRKIQEISSSMPRTIQLKSDLPHSSINVKCTPNQIETVIGNILNNAIRAVGNSGKITIIGNLIHTTSIYGEDLQELAPIPHFSLSVSDTGCGIPQKYLSRIFEPFFSNWAPPGNGLGLTQALTIVHSLGGTIDVTSKVGVGTTFTVLIPVSEFREDVLFRYPPRAEKIMVVDDDVHSLNATTTMLKILGFQPIALSDPEKAIDVFAKEKPDLVILDIIMPKLNGVELLRRILEISQCPVIAITGWSQLDTMDTLTREGVRYILQKPFDIEQLEKAINSVFAN